jgi:hypothetical protein
VTKMELERPPFLGKPAVMAVFGKLSWRNLLSCRCLQPVPTPTSQQSVAARSLEDSIHTQSTLRQCSTVRDDTGNTGAVHCDSIALLPSNVPLPQQKPVTFLEAWYSCYIDCMVRRIPYMHPSRLNRCCMPCGTVVSVLASHSWGLSRHCQPHPCTHVCPWQLLR